MTGLQPGACRHALHITTPYTRAQGFVGLALPYDCTQFVQDSPCTPRQRIQLLATVNPLCRLRNVTYLAPPLDLDLFRLCRSNRQGE